MPDICNKKGEADTLPLKGSMENALLVRMLKPPMREYVIKKIKAPLLKALILLGNPQTGLLKRVWLIIEIIGLAKRYPAPTRENTYLPSTHILMDTRDEFFTHEDNPDRKGLWETVWKIAIVENEHDYYYRQRIAWLIKRLKEIDWPAAEEPAHYWKP